MPVYDLMLKLEGMKALCGDGVTDNELSMILFPEKWELEPPANWAEMTAEQKAKLESKAAQNQRSDLSRLKAGRLVFSERLKAILTEDFNARIARNVLRVPNAPSDGTGIIRSEDWERPMHEFFGHLERGLGTQAAPALARAHAAIAAAIHGLQDYRQKHHALLIAAYDPTDAEQYRFPETAPPVDPLDLPPTRITARDPMIATLVDIVSDTPARGWLFYIRNPDTRMGIAQSQYIWDQSLSQMVYWHPDGPFDLPANYIGPLPGFPTKATSLEGEVTAYLLVESLESDAIAGLLRAPDPSWKANAAPSFDGFANLVTAKQRLFQKGNVLKEGDDRVKSPPPKLFIRRYRLNS